MKLNKTMMTDLYEITMAQTYFDDKAFDKIVYFDGFFRVLPLESGYAIMSGVDNIIDYIQNINFDNDDIEYLRSTNKFTEDFLDYLSKFKFNGDVWIVPDGTVVFGNEILITVRASLIEAQIIETTILSYLNSCIKYTTAARRLVEASNGKPIMEFGARRADGPEAAVLASKCAFIAGCVGTSNVMAGKIYDIPVMGTMAHSMISAEDEEYDAFMKYAKSFPDDANFLIDTYDTIKSGIVNSIKVTKDFLIPNGYRLKSVRIDSGDLSYLSKQVRKILDEEGMEDTKIVLSNSIDPYTLTSLLVQNAKFDSVGAGDNIVAPKARVGVVYKLVAIEENQEIVPRIKISNEALKIVNPGYKKLYRFYDKETGYALGDVMALHDEVIPSEEFTLIDPLNEFNTTTITNYTFKELQVPLFINGKLVYEDPDIREKQKYCNSQMASMYPEVKRLEYPHKYYVDQTQRLIDLKKDLILEHKKQFEG
ncbi:MAG: nicotinate phosphoribosyltransferase [Erysipelotrichaceae bacterium]|nr:nicotinate phosphoribosyltransferase [Erysipelotrichaceae bacterium]